MDVKFNIINIQHEKVNCTYTHVVTQEYLVAVSNVTHTIHFKSKEIQKYEGLSHAVTGLHVTVNSTQRSGGLISAGMGMACHLAHAMQAQLSGLGFMKCFLYTTTFSA